MRRLIILVAFALSGCWEGANLFADTDARPGIAAGTYEIVPRGEAAQPAQISVLPSGMTKIVVDREPSVIGFVPLDGSAQRYVSWSTEKDLQLYQLAIRQPDSTIVIYLPSCEGEEAEIAHSAGATVKPGTVQTCTFHSRSSVEAAMRRIQPRADQEVLRLIPVSK